MNQEHAPKNPVQQDWHRADVKAALEKAGWSLRRLAAHHGYASRCTLVHALDRPWPKGQALIAEAIGVAPETIWPSRYARQNHGDGSPSCKDLTPPDGQLLETEDKRQPSNAPRSKTNEASLQRMTARGQCCVS